MIDVFCVLLSNNLELNNDIRSMSIEVFNCSQDSLSETSHKSQDSGFSDSESHGAMAQVSTSCKSITPSDLWKSSSYKSASCEDLSTLPHPPHSSTPKPEENSWCRQKRKPLYSTRDCHCPVKFWLKEVRYICDPECTSTLQSKTITAGTNETVTKTTSLVVYNIRSLCRHLSILCYKLNMLNRQINKGNLKTNGRLFDKIIQSMQKILSDHNKKLVDFDCKSIQIAFSALKSGEKDVASLKSIMKTVAHLFSEKIEQILLMYIKMLIDLLQNEKSPSSLCILLYGLGSLGLETSHLADLLAHCSGITSLLSVFINCSSSAVHTAALNILSTICCTPHSVTQFENSGGLDFLCDILTDPTKGKAEHCAAISLLVQVTAPWLEVTINGVENHLQTFVSAATRLINHFPTSEMLLLCTAALANISCIEPNSVWNLMYSCSVKAVLKAVRILGPKASVFVKEQAVTLLANMSGELEILPHLTQNRAVPALLCFLQVSLSPLQDSAETLASYRVQHKAVIALSRLCDHFEAAMQVVELQGISRLVRLCREETERNNNDSVLACSLVTLRKISKHCGPEAVKKLNASELIEPQLVESILLYSSKNFIRK